LPKQEISWFFSIIFNNFLANQISILFIQICWLEDYSKLNLLGAQRVFKKFESKVHSNKKDELYTNTLNQIKSKEFSNCGGVKKLKAKAIVFVY
jgi:hypothetical protein